jgi:hypothetical protein
MTGAEMLIQEIARLQEQGIAIKFCALKNTVKDELISSGYWEALGPGNSTTPKRKRLRPLQQIWASINVWYAQIDFFSRV